MRELLEEEEEEEEEVEGPARARASAAAASAHADFELERSELRRGRRTAFPQTYLLFRREEAWYEATYDPSCNSQQLLDDADVDEQFP